MGVYLDGAAEQSNRKIKVFHTDGGDTGGAMVFGELLDLLKASDATAYVVRMVEYQMPARKGAPRPQEAGVLSAVGEEPGRGP